jgi:hypothetical protein
MRAVHTGPDVMMGVRDSGKRRMVALLTRELDVRFAACDGLHALHAIVPDPVTRPASPPLA